MITYKMIISDSSPLIHLTRIGKLEFVVHRFHTIVIPNEVYAEVVERGLEREYSEAQLLQNYKENGQLVVEEVEQPLPELKNALHQAESEAITLAKEKDALLLIDERKGRRIAEQLGITFSTTMGMLLYLLKQKTIDFHLYASNLAKYSAEGWFSLDLYQQYLTEGKKYE